MIIGEERPEKNVLQNKTPRVAEKASTPGGQDKKKRTDDKSIGLTGSQGGLISILTGLTSTQTGLTGMSSGPASSSKVKNKARPSFKKLLGNMSRKGKHLETEGKTK